MDTKRIAQIASRTFGVDRAEYYVTCTRSTCVGSLARTRAMVSVHLDAETCLEFTSKARVLDIEARAPESTS